jgi:sugar/nucleoside kinase (ribokinase family)
LRIAIASHIVLDKVIMDDGRMLECVGGPPCYCGITSRRFGLDVSLVTKAGSDLPKEVSKTLQNYNIMLGDDIFVSSPTTRFQIICHGHSRDLKLFSKCEPLTIDDIQKTKTDCWLVSPVIDELPQNVLAEIKHNRGKKNFIMLDPQGYLRLIGPDGRIAIRDKLDLDVSGINAIKVDCQEMAALSGGLQGLAGMQALHSRGIEFVVHTDNRTIHLLHDQRHYWFTLQKFDTVDSTGLGDILSAAFSCAYIKEKDPIWAICFAVGAVTAALETRQVGIAKIPSIRDVEETASYLYNGIKFQHVS